MISPSMILLAATLVGGVGDPQVKTDHAWYPGELACSTFDRLFATQAEVYRRETGREVISDEDRALASWFWRNAHYRHGEEGVEDLWGGGFTRGGDPRTREYWTGLFAHGFGLCGTTHSQWTAEFEAMLGHGRARGVGCDGHNSFEVFLTGGSYGAGRWALLDHDISTVIFDPEGRRLLALGEVRDDWARLTDRSFRAGRQRGWLVCGLHPDDGGVYRRFDVAEPLAGYVGPPPMVHLRRGEAFRRYLRPGLSDGKTFAFWGRNMNAGGVAGPERAETWVNQPGRMIGSTTGAGHETGRARYGNAASIYIPDFTADDYREGLVDEGPAHVTFGFATPYIIAATPPDDSPWDVYSPGCRNGLVLSGKASGPVAVSVDRGATWRDCGPFVDRMDLTDHVKGSRQYALRIGAGADALRGSGLTITTVCQANESILPRLKDGGTTVTFAAGGHAVVSAGPTLPQAARHVIEGGFGTARVTLDLATPRGERVVAVTAAAHVNSSNPPDPAVRYQVELSTDSGATWSPLVKDWSIPRPGDQPPDSWSQSLCWGSIDLAPGLDARSARVRFCNDGGKSYARAELHLTYALPEADPTRVTFAWHDDAGLHETSHMAGIGPSSWTIPTGHEVVTRWIEFAPAPAR